MSTNHDFDPNSILNFHHTEVKTAENKELDTPGFRPMAVIDKLDIYPPSDKFPKEGSIARLKFTWRVEDTGEVLIKRVDLYRELKDTQKMFEVLDAIWGERMFEFTIEGLEGCKCPLYIKHEINTASKDKTKYADYTYEAGPREHNFKVAEGFLAKAEAAEAEA